MRRKKVVKEIFDMDVVQKLLDIWNDYARQWNDRETGLIDGLLPSDGQDWSPLYIIGFAQPLSSILFQLKSEERENIYWQFFPNDRKGVFEAGSYCKRTFENLTKLKTVKRISYVDVPSMKEMREKSTR